MKSILMFSLLIALMVSVSVASVSANQDPPVPPNPPTPTATPDPQPVPRCGDSIGRGIITNHTSWDVKINGDIEGKGWRTYTLKPGQSSNDTDMCDVDYIMFEDAYRRMFPAAIPGHLWNPGQWGKPASYMWGNQRCIDRSEPNFPYADCSTGNWD